MLVPYGDSTRVFPGLDRLQQSALDFEEIFRNSFDGIFVADGAGMTLMVNEGCERNYDLSAADMIGRHVSEFEKAGWIRPVVAAQVARTGQRISTTQHTHTGKTMGVDEIWGRQLWSKLQQLTYRGNSHGIALENPCATAGNGPAGPDLFG